MVLPPSTRSGPAADVVVLDLMMPKLSGVDVLKFIRSQGDLKTLPVVVLSNSYMNQLAAEAAELA
jgi:CheY-like chemotaxis protein